ncbi:MAG: hypothetical protein RR988_04860, partial [Clostridia bacterium]
MKNTVDKNENIEGLKTAGIVGIASTAISMLVYAFTYLVCNIIGYSVVTVYVLLSATVAVLLIPPLILTIFEKIDQRLYRWIPLGFVLEMCIFAVVGSVMLFTGKEYFSSIIVIYIIPFVLLQTGWAFVSAKILSILDLRKVWKISTSIMLPWFLGWLVVIVFISKIVT